MNKYTEIIKKDNRSLVEVKDLEKDAVYQYIIVTDFNNAKTEKYDQMVRSYWINNYLTQSDAFKAAINYFYNIKELEIPYDRVMEFTKELLACLDIDEIKDHLKDDMKMTEREAEWFGIKEELFPRRYKVANVTFTREQRITVKVIMPEDEADCNAEDYVENQCYLDDCADIENEDWECEDYGIERSDLDEDDIRDRYDLDEIWNGSDFPDDI